MDAFTMLDPSRHAVLGLAVTVPDEPRAEWTIRGVGVNTGDTAAKASRVATLDCG